MVKLLRYLSVYLVFLRVCLARLASIGITVHSMSVSTSVHVSLPSFHQLFSHVHGLIILHHLMRTLTQDSANLDAGMHGFVAVHVILSGYVLGYCICSQSRQKFPPFLPCIWMSYSLLHHFLIRATAYRMCHIILVI